MRHLRLPAILLLIGALSAPALSVPALAWDDFIVLTTDFASVGAPLPPSFGED